MGGAAATAHETRLIPFAPLDLKFPVLPHRLVFNFCQPSFYGLPVKLRHQILANLGMHFQIVNHGLRRYRGFRRFMPLP